MCIRPNRVQSSFPPAAKKSGRPMRPACAHLIEASVMHRKPRSNIALIARLLPLTLLQCLNGCLFTGPMWRDANACRVTDPDIFGIIEASANVSDAAADDRQSLLVIRYSINEGEDLYATIPLTPSGCPREPFNYAGASRRPEEIVADLPEAQR